MRDSGAGLAFIPFCHCRVGSKRGRIRSTRTVVVLVCSIALACAARGEKKEQKKEANHAKTSQHATTHSEHPAAKSAPVHHTQAPQHVASPRAQPAPARAPERGNAAQITQPGHPQPQGDRPRAATAAQPAAPALTKEQQDEVDAQGQGFRSAEQYRKWKETGRVDAPEAAIVTARKPAGAAVGAPPRKFNPRHFDLPSTRGLGVETAKFQGTGHIEGSENWNGEKYATFRNYHHEWHDGEWWRHHHNRVVLIFGGWYYWHRGYWYPAWGYDSHASYAYDGPIYAYNNLPPDQVVANVQAALRELGYYNGPIDGLLGSPTRTAIANFQRDQGLYTTSAIDERTLASLGMT